MGINLTRKYNTCAVKLQLSKEIEEGLNKWKDHHVHGLEDNIKMAVIPKLIYRFNAVNPHQNPSSFSTDRQADHKIHMETQGAQNNQKNLEKEDS